MATEDQREAGIHWSVAVQEAARLVSSAPTGERTPEEVGEQIVKIAAEIWAWRGQCFPNGAVAQPAQGDPGPTPPDESYDNDPPHPAEAERGFARPAPQVCRCGADMEYNSATEARSAAYFCPNKTKSRDPRVQEEQNLLHPPVWIKGV